MFASRNFPTEYIDFEECFDCLLKLCSFNIVYYSIHQKCLKNREWKQNKNDNQKF